MILCILIPHMLYHTWLLFHVYRRERYLVILAILYPSLCCSSTFFATLESALPHFGIAQWIRTKVKELPLHGKALRVINCTERIPFDIESMSFNDSTHRKQA